MRKKKNTKCDYATRKSEKEKALRAQRKSEKMEGRKQERLLAPIEALFRLLGYNYRSLAKKAGLTTQGVFAIFGLTDDAPLKTIERLLKAIGIRLIVILEPLPDRIRKIEQSIIRTDWECQGVAINLKGNLPKIRAGHAYPLPSFIEEYPKDGISAFLAEVIEKNGYSLSLFSELTGISPQRLRYLFLNDNIRIRDIAQIARALNMKIVYEVQPCSSEDVGK